jgi:hypothetical protein
MSAQSLLIAAITASDAENQFLRSENQVLRDQLDAERSNNHRDWVAINALREQLDAERSNNQGYRAAINSLREQLAIPPPPILCVNISKEDDQKRIEKNRKYIKEHEVDCECGGKTSTTPSRRASHESRKQHTKHIQNKDLLRSAAFNFWKEMTKQDKERDNEKNGEISKHDKQLKKNKDARNACKIKCACGGVSYSGKKFEAVRQRHETRDRHKRHVADDISQFSDSIDDLV